VWELWSHWGHDGLNRWEPLIWVDRGSGVKICPE